ncbi:ferrochelatase [Paenibacillus sp. MMS20-IR301]|uniref:ferrochelatase n=1 Tax=Paenibacillus sp. MMS20-IR301 TaxID=2895946 RepID=UPI0028EE11E4|nr:ferrochelatase [Paenibacillus sp. MMS20-IR301]WNS40878.1 ferrochelatase [Paenibacillus sp. MMS20-IR301]
MNQPLIGVILAQIGTPDAPNSKAVRPYLRRFLSDRRIIDYHPLLWQPLLHGIILRTRPGRSAKLYQEIWMEEGSPLLVYSRKQQASLQQLLGSRYQVELGLAYSKPGMPEAFRRLEAAGITRIIVLPLFPQYSSTTTASVYEAASFAALGRHSSSGQVSKRFVPALRFIEAYHDAPGYIAAMKSLLLRQIGKLKEEPDYYILSFHGIPRRYAETGDPYPQQCHETGRLLAEAMGWAPDRWQLTFQSRFGPEKWVGPSTADTLTGLSGRGIRRPLVFSPGLVTDCLETLHELAVEGRELYASGGGTAGNLSVAPCLNDDSEWMAFLSGLVNGTAQGWLQPAEAADGSHLPD